MFPMNCLVISALLLETFRNELLETRCGLFSDIIFYGQLLPAEFSSQYRLLDPFCSSPAPALCEELATGVWPSLGHSRRVVFRGGDKEETGASIHGD